MPRGNRMGPGGQGPMTGRGAGYCAGYGAPGFASPGPGGGFGGGRSWGGRGGWRHRNWFGASGLPGWMRAWAGAPDFTEEPPAPTGQRLAALPGPLPRA